jgi:cation diffusion facilitator family transporter
VSEQGPAGEPDAGHRHDHHDDLHRPHHHHHHHHSHAGIDVTLATSERGIWAVKWSFAALAVTALLQLVVVRLSGSVALLADTIHNLGDAATAIPLWIAFRLGRRPPTPRFSYGYGRVEDLAGVSIVLIILFSAAVAGYEAVDRLLHPRGVEYLGAVAVASIIGFLGNELVAIFRIRVGREIGSAALVADGYHARVDGLASLAVLAGAAGVYLGYPLADPVVGLLITVVILGIVWESGRAVFTRLLDGVDGEVLEQVRREAGRVPGVRGVAEVRARWVGHRLHAEVNIAVDPDLPVREGHALAKEVHRRLMREMRYLAVATIHVDPTEEAGERHHRAT